MRGESRALSKREQSRQHMKHIRAFCLMAIVGLVVGIGDASAQTLELRTKRVAEQSTVVEKSSTLSRVKVWTRARWEAARKHWARDNAKFYACSDKWRERTGGRKYSFHDQREFLFQCMNNTNVTQFGEPSCTQRQRPRPGQGSIG